MSVTLRDVAKRCGLSPSTVSGVLNNRSSTWASVETRRRVFEAASTLGYRPHSAARALRTGKTHVVAFLSHLDSGGQYSAFDGSAEIMASHLGRFGYDLKLHIYPDQAELMQGLDDIVRRKSCDAVVLFGDEADVSEQGRFLEKYDIPFVVKGRHEREFPNWYQVDYDHEGMMEVVVAKFAAANRKRIAYIGYSQGPVYQKRLLSGFEQAVEKYTGQKPTPPHIALQKPEHPSSLQEAITYWFNGMPRDAQPDAVVIGTSTGEWQAIERVLAEQRRFIGNSPNDVMVAGQAGFQLSLAYGTGEAFADVSFASIAQTAVCDLLLPLLQDEKPETPVRRILPALIPIVSLGLPRPTTV